MYVYIYVNVYLKLRHIKKELFINIYIYIYLCVYITIYMCLCASKYNHNGPPCALVGRARLGRVLMGPTGPSWAGPLGARPSWGLVDPPGACLYN